MAGRWCVNFICGSTLKCDVHVGRPQRGHAVADPGIGRGGGGGGHRRRCGEGWGEVVGGPPRGGCGRGAPLPPS